LRRLSAYITCSKQWEMKWDTVRFEVIYSKDSKVPEQRKFERKGQSSILQAVSASCRASAVRVRISGRDRACTLLLQLLPSQLFFAHKRERKRDRQRERERERERERRKEREREREGERERAVAFSFLTELCDATNTT
jgi:hypothetical protein